MCESVTATITLLNDATAWIDRSIPPSITTKVIPAARMKRVAVSAITTNERINRQKTRSQSANERDQSEQEQNRYGGPHGADCRKHFRGRLV